MLSSIATDEKMPFNQFLALLGRTHYWNNENQDEYNYELGLQYQQIFNGKNPFDDSKLTIDQAIYVLQKAEIGRTRYTDLKKFLSEFVGLPGYQNLRDRIRQLVPELIKSKTEGVWVDIKAQYIYIWTVIS